MSKGILYASPRTAQRHEKADYARALEVFQSCGRFDGSPVLVAYVVTYCFDRHIAFRWQEADAPAGLSKVERA